MRYRSLMHYETGCGCPATTEETKKRRTLPEGIPHRDNIEDFFIEKRTAQISKVSGCLSG
jgi:hypothetical protein